jgi:hypothetical protein
MDNRAQKSILQTNTKPVSKNRRISWGEVKIKEFGLEDEVRNQVGDEYNITIADIHQNNTILEESHLEDSISAAKDNKNNITTNILDDSILNRNSLDITKPFNSQPVYSFRNSIEDYFPRITLCDNNINSITKNDSVNKARITLDPRTQLLQSNDKENDFRKRNSLNLRQTLDMIINNNEEEENFNELSVSPINNAQKIYYDTRMASTSKILEEKRDNNDRITIFQIYHDKGNTPKHLKRNDSDIDRRINGLIDYISESINVREKMAEGFERESIEYDTKLQELETEKGLIAARKNKIKEEIERFDRVYLETLEVFKINKYLFKMLGMKILSSEFGLLKIQLFKKININFKFDEKIDLKFIYTSHDRREYIPSPKINFEFIDKSMGIKSQSAQSLIRNIYDHLLSGIFNTITIPIFEFFDTLKRLIKITSAFLYFCEILNICHTASIDMGMSYIKEKRESQVSISLLNKMGFKIKFEFIISLINPFYGISMKDYQIININLSDTNFSKSEKTAIMLINEIKSFLQQVDKLKNPIFFKDFIIKLNKRIFNL